MTETDSDRQRQEKIGRDKQNQAETDRQAEIQTGIDRHIGIEIGMQTARDPCNNQNERDILHSNFDFDT